MKRINIDKIDKKEESLGLNLGDYLLINNEIFNLICKFLRNQNFFTFILIQV